MTRHPMTKEGELLLREELRKLKSKDRKEVVKAIAEARELGDLKENAEYHAQRENQGMMQAKINLVRDKLSRATIVDESKLPKDRIVFGSTVLVKDLDLAEEETFILVGEGEENYDTGHIKITSPIAQGLVGKKPGEIAEIEVPSGVLRFEIVEIS